MEVWQTWIVVAVALFILEIFTPGFILACFGFGCLGAGMMDYLGFGVIYQIAAFSIVSFILFLTIRPIVKKHLYKRNDNTKTNVEALIGQIGLVDETIDPADESGRVRVGGDNWRAISLDNKIIEKGNKVEVQRVEGTKVFVTLHKTNQEN